MQRFAAATLALWLVAAVPDAGALDMRSPTTINNGVLTDALGMTLYTFDLDVADSGRSACYGPCAASWPPFVAYDDEASGSDFTTIMRTDGTRQWTFQGKPLYYWSGDRQPGDSLGDGRHGVWHAVRP